MCTKQLKKVPTSEPCSMWDEPEECLQPQHQQQKCNDRGLQSRAGQGSFGHCSSPQREHQHQDITKWKYQLTQPAPASLPPYVIKQRSSLPEGHQGCHRAGWIPWALRWMSRKKSTVSNEHQAVGDALAIPQHSCPGSPLKVRDARDPSKGGRRSSQKEGRLKANTQMRLAITLIIALRLFFGERSQ